MVTKCSRIALVLTATRTLRTLWINYQSMKASSLALLPHPAQRASPSIPIRCVSRANSPPPPLLLNKFCHMKNICYWQRKNETETKNATKWSETYTWILMATRKMKMRYPLQGYPSRNSRLPPGVTFRPLPLAQQSQSALHHRLSQPGTTMYTHSLRSLLSWKTAQDHKARAQGHGQSKQQRRTLLSFLLPPLLLRNEMLLHLPRLLPLPPNIDLGLPRRREPSLLLPPRPPPPRLLTMLRSLTEHSNLQHRNLHVEHQEAMATRYRKSLPLPHITETRTMKRCKILLIA